MSIENMQDNQLKTEVKNFWDQASCGEIYASGQTAKEYYDAHGKARYELEPYIISFARFYEGYNKDILEIGTGMGADLMEWAKSGPKSLTGIDLTVRSVEHTRRRLTTYGFQAAIEMADAENLPYDNESFDLVYSWGVLHHSPDTPTAINEVYRVLRNGGVAKIMIYHKYSLVGYLLWIRYALLNGKFTRGLDDIYWHHLESPGTKAYTMKQTQQMFAKFTDVKLSSQLSFGELLQGNVGQRHQGLLLTIAKRIWPRTLLKIIFRNHGGLLLIEAQK
jgi:ubiquinone/menaquinone biosynthesis C-methylase UbiE